MKVKSSNMVQWTNTLICETLRSSGLNFKPATINLIISNVAGIESLESAGVCCWGNKQHLRPPVMQSLMQKDIFLI